MDNEDRIFDLMSKMYDEMQEGFSNVNSQLKTANERLDQFEKDTITRFNSLENQIDTISNKLDDLDAKNADRHVIMGKDIKEMKSDITRIELNTADNWKDIVRFKAIER